VGLLRSMKNAIAQTRAADREGAGALDMAAAVADRGALESQAHEQNRILLVGSRGTALIRSHVDTGEQAAGNPIWIFDLEVTPEGGSPYGAQHREIVSSMAIGSYVDGTTIACRIDPADPQNIAFGEQPFM
jgi:GAF domain-containing protein